MLTAILPLLMAAPGSVPGAAHAAPVVCSHAALSRSGLPERIANHA